MAVRVSFVPTDRPKAANFADIAGKFQLWACRGRLSMLIQGCCSGGCYGSGPARLMPNISHYRDILWRCYATRVYG